MTGKNLFRKSLAASLLFAVWSMTSMVALAQTGQMASGELTASGSVTVNNRAAVSNSTVASGSTITTGENSSATVNLGKTGSLEITPNTTLVLKFDETGVYGTLENGKVRVMNMSGKNANISTREGMVIADAAQANTFSVEKECGHTHVDTMAGTATLRANGEDKQVAAGTEALAGSLQQTGCKPCMRPAPGGSAKVPTLGLSSGALLGLLAAAGAAVVIGLVASSGRGNSTSTGGGVIVVSPTR